MTDQTRRSDQSATDALRGFALDLVRDCFDPADPDAFARYATDPGARSSFGLLARAFPDARMHVRWVAAEDQRVVLGCRLQGTHRGPWKAVPPSGRCVDVPCLVSFVVDDGGIIELEQVTDTLALVEQVGAVSLSGAS